LAIFLSSADDEPMAVAGVVVGVVETVASTAVCSAYSFPKGAKFTPHVLPYGFFDLLPAHQVRQRIVDNHAAQVDIVHGLSLPQDGGCFYHRASKEALGLQSPLVIHENLKNSSE